MAVWERDHVSAAKDFAAITLPSDRAGEANGARRDRIRACKSASGGRGFSMKVIDLDSWETGYADGELGRAIQCPIGCDCHRLSYLIGYRAGRESRAGARRKAPRLRYPQLSIEVRRTRPP